MLLEARDEEGTAADRPRAARRADDPAAGRPRDDGDGAELDPGAPRPPPGASLARLREERRGGEGADAYLDATIKESLRLRPVVTAVGRYLTAPLEIGGHLLPAGVSINPSIYLLHRRPDLYPEPEAFRPERFLDDPPGTYEWIPFGGGVRRCLGASFALFEMRIVLQTVLDRVDLVPQRRADERVTRRAITFAPNRGARIAVEAA